MPSLAAAPEGPKARPRDSVKKGKTNHRSHDPGLACVIEFSLHRPGARIELPARSTSKTDSVCLTLAGEWPTKFRMPATKYATEPATAPNVL